MGDVVCGRQLRSWAYKPM